MNYLGLLRGINVGGKNKVAMAELRECFEYAGFTNVTTYINSGNIFFSSKEINQVQLIATVETIIEKQFGFKVIVMVISTNDLSSEINSSPAWWGKSGINDIRSNALFVIPPTTPKQVLMEVLKKKSKVDQFYLSEHILFWSLPMSDYNKSVVPKIIGTPIYKSITMRSSTTTRKLVELAKKL